jgi:hypothetical protein
MSPSFPWLSPLQIACIVLMVISMHFWGRRRRARAASAEPAAVDVPLSAAVTRAAALPLLDAAYDLWRQRHSLDRDDRLFPKPFLEPGEFPTKPEYVRAMRADVDRMNNETLIAATPASTTFARLKKAHPEALDHERAAAISTALRFEGTYLSYDDLDLPEAIAAMRKAFPNYTDQTYDSAYSHLRFETR